VRSIRVVNRGLAVVVSAVLTVAALTVPARADSLDRNGELVADGSWCWFQDPRAVHYVGAHDRTYVGYVTSTGDIDVVSQDAGTALLTHSTLHARLQADDHAAPGLAVLPDGRIAVFYSPHVWGQMRYRISSRPEDISSFEPEESVPTNVGPDTYTYANPIYLSAEKRLYLFFRGGDERPVMTWTTDYVHWAPAVDVVVPDNTPDNTRPYVKYATNGVDTINITFTDGHPREVTRNSVYQLAYRAGTLRTPDGAPVSVLDPTAVTDQPLEVPHTGAVHTDWLRDTAHPGLVYDDTGGGVAWPQGVSMAPDRSPVIVYATYHDTSDAQYYYARWNGSGWTTSRITDAGGSINTNPVEAQYSGGADIDRTDPGLVYLSRETSPGSGQWEIESWQTDNGGATFARTEIITPNPTVKNVRPVVPWGPRGEIRMLWMAGTYLNYNAGQYHTQLREITTGRAPTTARISTSTTVTDPGRPVTIAGRLVQGYQGTPLPGATVELVGHAAGQPDYVVRRAVADRQGLVSFTIYPSATMRLFVRTPQTTDFGASASPSILATVRTPPAVRISASAASIHKGQPVTLDLRAVDARSGARLAGSRIELWQHTINHPWQRVGTFTSDAGGLVRTTRRPSVTVIYQAKVLASSTHLAASSPQQTVRVS